MSTIGTICDVVRIAYVASDLLDKVKKINNEPLHEGRDVRIASAAMDVISLGLNIADCGAGLRGASNKTRFKIKDCELIVKCVDIPIKMTEYSHEDMSDLDFLERGILAPIAGAVRVSNQKNIYKEKNTIEQALKESNYFGHVVENEHDKTQIDDPKVIKDSEDRLESCLEFAPTSSFVETALLTGMVSKVGTKIFSNGAGAAAGPISGAGAGVVAADIDPFNLLEQSNIPFKLHDDVIFRRYVCPMSRLPIRHPLGIPNEPHAYEASFLRRWVTDHQNSPMTRLPLQINELVEKPHLQELINHRLRYHQRRLNAAADASMGQPAQVRYQTPADRENPGLVGDE